MFRSFLVERARPQLVPLLRSSIANDPTFHLLRGARLVLHSVVRHPARPRGWQSSDTKPRDANPAGPNPAGHTPPF
jgi:hypothetical protein